MAHLNLWRSPNTSSERKFIQNPWDFFSTFESELKPFFSTGSTVEKGKLLTPNCDVTETEDNFLLSFDVPGLKKEDIEIDVTGSTLTISGERMNQHESAEGNVHRIERNFGKFERKFSLPEGSNIDQIQATYDNGVLELSVPKPEIIKPKKIQIGINGKAEKFNNKIAEGTAAKSKTKTKSEEKE